jgi:hypothetical protein
MKTLRPGGLPGEGHGNRVSGIHRHPVEITLSKADTFAVFQIDGGYDDQQRPPGEFCIIAKKWIVLTLQRRLLFISGNSSAIFSYESFWIFLCYAAAS